jgi:predicted esterase
MRSLTRRLVIASLFIASLFILGSMPALLLAADEKPALPKWKKGVQEGTVEIAGKEEAFVALVPKGYSPKKKWPVVLLLHGNGGKAANFLNTVKPALGKKPPLLISLERCDNNQDAVGYCPKYLEALRTQFSLDDANVFALGFSGGGFRLWDDVVCKAEELPRYRGVILFGSAKQSFEPPEKPESAPTVILVGDPKDSNFTETAPAAEKALTERDYEVFVLEHRGGHSVARKELEDVFEWIAAVVAGKKPKLETRRVDDDGKKKKKKKR